MTKKYVAALDQGTTSTRAILFNQKGKIVATSQMEHEQIFPRAGWVEHDAREIWVKTLQVAGGVMAKADIEPEQVAAIGITNQRETTVVWDRETGKPIHNAIVWQDLRTAEICHELEAAGHGELFRHRAGLPIATYFSGPKVKWILDNVDGARAKAEAGELMFGTIDTWLTYKMSGGKKGGVHVTDVTNASRTMLMNLETLDWDPELAEILGIPMSMLPEIKPSSHVYGQTGGKSIVPGIPIAGILGDQQAALFGQACLNPGEVKNTYGTGQFVLMNTGTEIFRSRNGLITTVAYQLGEDSPAIYALEGSVAVSGSLVQWLRDNLGMISSAPEVETLAASVEDNGGAYIVPAFSGLFAPYWRDDARGVIVGLTRFVNKGHIARAALESVAHQSVDVIEAMNADSGVPIRALKVDGGMVVNDLLMQFQSDIADVPVIRPKVAETTALGAAYAAGLAVGYWDSTDEIVANWAEDCRWEPAMDDDRRATLRKEWSKAVQRTLDWAE